MQPPMPKEAAEAMVLAAYHMPNETAIKIDVGGWPDQAVQVLFNTILALLDQHKLRLRGVRTDTASLAKLAIPKDTQNSGLYNGIPVVMTPTADFDTMEFVFQPV